MKNKLSSIIVAITFSIFLFPVTTNAIGQISKPIIIENALRGQKYQEEIVIFNTENIDQIIELSSTGDIQNWVTFYQLNDSQTKINEAAIDKSTNLKLIAIIQIPDTAPNGKYSGLISAASKPGSSATSSESVANLSQKIDRPVSITVSDNEIIKMEASVIPNKYDLTEGEPLSIRFIYDNQGNIDIRPQIALKIKKDDKIIHNVIYPYPLEAESVRPNQRYEIDQLVLQTFGYEIGEYIADFDFLINNESKFAERLGFTYGVYNSDNNSDNYKNKFTIIGYIKNNVITSSLLAIAILSIILIFLIKENQKKN